MESWSGSWSYLTALQPQRPQNTPFHTSALWLITSLWSLLIPYTHLTAISVASQGRHKIPETWPQLAVLGQLFTVEKISLWYSVRLAASAEEGRKFARDLVACGPLGPHLLPLLPKEGSCLFSGHTISCPRIKIWLYSQVLFSQKLPREATEKTPAQAWYHSWQTAATRKPEWNQSESGQAVERNQIWI